MPRLPDDTALGVRPIARPSTSVVGIRTGQVEAAAAELGETVSRIGTNIQEQEDRFNYALAKSKLSRELLATKGEFAEDNEWQTLPKRYEERLTKIKTETASMIKSPRDRQLFEADIQENIQRELLQINQIAKAKEVDWGRATLTDEVTKLRESLPKAAGESERVALINSAHGLIQGAKDRGYLDESDVVKFRQQVGEDYASSSVSLLKPQEQIDILQSEKGVAKFIPFDKRQQMIERAQNEIKRQQMELRTDVSLFLQDELTSLQMTGQRAGLLSDETIKQAFAEEPAKAAKLIDQLNSAQQFYTVRQKVALTSPDEDRQTLENLKNSIAGMNAVQSAQQYEDYARAVNEKNKLLLTDPVAYVSMAAPDIAEGLRSTDPNTFRQSVEQASMLQEQLGVPEYRKQFLGKAAAQETTLEINASSPERVADRMAILANQYGKYWPQVMRELKAADLSPAYMPLARLVGPTDATVRTQVASAIQSREQSEIQIGKEAVKEINEKVRAKYQQFAKTFIADGEAGLQVLHAETSAAEALAYVYRQQGYDADDATTLATNKLINNRYDFVDTYRTPKGLSDQVESAAYTQMRELTEGLMPALPGADPNVSDEYRRRAALDYAKQGFWANTPDGKGVELLYPDGSPVILESGERVTVDFTRLNDFMPIEDNFESAVDLTGLDELSRARVIEIIQSERLSPAAAQRAVEEARRRQARRENR